MRRSFIIALAFVIPFLAAFPEVLAKDKNKDQSDEIRKLEEQWLNAYIQSDANLLSTIEADDFILNDPSGAAKGKSEDIQEVKSGVMKWSSAHLDEIKVRFYGKTAVATGSATIKGTYNGQDMSGRYRFTDVFVRKQQDWHAVSSQVTSIAPANK